MRRRPDAKDKKVEEETAAIEKRTREKIEKAAIEEKKVEALKEEKERCAQGDGRHRARVKLLEHLREFLW